MKEKTAERFGKIFEIIQKSTEIDYYRSKLTDATKTLFNAVIGLEDPAERTKRLNRDRSLSITLVKEVQKAAHEKEHKALQEALQDKLFYTQFKKQIDLLQRIREQQKAKQRSVYQLQELRKEIIRDQQAEQNQKKDYDNAVKHIQENIKEIRNSANFRDVLHNAITELDANKIQEVETKLSQILKHVNDLKKQYEIEEKEVLKFRERIVKEQQEIESAENLIQKITQEDQVEKEELDAVVILSDLYAELLRTIEAAKNDNTKRPSGVLKKIKGHMENIDSEKFSELKQGIRALIENYKRLEENVRVETETARKVDEAAQEIVEDKNLESEKKHSNDVNKNQDDGGFKDNVNAVSNQHITDSPKYDGIKAAVGSSVSGSSQVNRLGQADIIVDGKGETSDGKSGSSDYKSTNPALNFQDESIAQKLPKEIEEVEQEAEEFTQQTKTTIEKIKAHESSIKREAKANSKKYKNNLHQLTKEDIHLFESNLDAAQKMFEEHEAKSKEIFFSKQFTVLESTLVTVEKKLSKFLKESIKDEELAQLTQSYLTDTQGKLTDLMKKAQVQESNESAYYEVSKKAISEYYTYIQNWKSAVDSSEEVFLQPGQLDTLQDSLIKLLVEWESRSLEFLETRKKLNSSIKSLYALHNPIRFIQLVNLAIHVQDGKSKYDPEASKEIEVEIEKIKSGSHTVGGINFLKSEKSVSIEKYIRKRIKGGQKE